MTNHKDYNKTNILIVGAGPAGLSCAITLKKQNPDLEVCVIDKAATPGGHNLSGAVLEPAAIHKLLDPIDPDWPNSENAQGLIVGTVEKDNVLFLLTKKFAFPITFAIGAAAKFKLGFGQMSHKKDYIVSISKLTAFLCRTAADLGTELIHSFAADDILYDPASGRTTSVKLVDQGIDKEGHKQPNFVPGETISADIIILAEGCDGLLTEKFIEKASLERNANQLYSLGVKEVIKVSDSQYSAFGSDRVVHAMGFPIWTPVIGPGMFGGGIMYPMGDNKIAVGMIVGLDYKYRDFNPQDALTLFKQHSFVKKFIDGGQIPEAGAKMIPEGGLRAIPRDPQTGSIGKVNTLILGDSAGFVNMLKIKGLHNAIESGIAAANAVAENPDPSQLARKYTDLLEQAGIIKEMHSAKNFRQTVSQFGPLQGMPLSVLGSLLPEYNTEPDYESMTEAPYRLKPDVNFDKDTFTAMAATEHREEQPSHLEILDQKICDRKCTPEFCAPCITFCPAGVYETIQNVVKPANPSNCLHCKTCQRKCPFDNIRWTAPEGAGGPKYKNM